MDEPPSIADVDRMSLEHIARGLAMQLEPHKAARVALMMLTFVKLGTEELAKIDPKLAAVHDLCERALSAADREASRLVIPRRRVM